MSYENLILYGATIPSFDKDENKGVEEKKDEEVVDLDNPEDWGKIKGFFKNRK